MNVLPLGEVDFDDLTVYPRFHENAVESLNRAEARQENGNICAPDLSSHTPTSRDAPRARLRTGWPQHLGNTKISHRSGNNECPDQTPTAHSFSDMLLQKRC